MASKGIGSGFKIDNASNSLTDVSSYLRGVNWSASPERLDATVLQPDTASPVKTEINGVTTRGCTLTVLYSAAAYTLFTGIEGSQGLDYQYGPDGFTSGDQKISGLCNCLSVSEPAAHTSNVLEVSVELNVTSRSISTF